MKYILVISIFTLLAFSCQTNAGTASELNKSNTESTSDTLNNSFSPKKQIDSLHAVLAEFLRNPNDTTLVSSMDDIWRSIVSDSTRVFSYLVAFKDSINSYSIYGPEYFKKLKTIKKLPSSIYALFLYRAIKEEDFLFNRRICTNTMYFLFMNPKLNFPIFTETELDLYYVGGAENLTLENARDISLIIDEKYNEQILLTWDKILSNSTEIFRIEFFDYKSFGLLDFKTKELKSCVSNEYMNIKL